MYLLLLSMSAHLTKELGMAPGGEFRRAFREAHSVPGCLVHLGDRPINITLKRALGSLSIWQKIKLGFNILTSKDSITKEDVEKCKQKDLLESMLEEMAGNNFTFRLLNYCSASGFSILFSHYYLFINNNISIIKVNFRHYQGFLFKREIYIWLIP